MAKSQGTFRLELKFYYEENPQLIRFYFSIESLKNTFGKMHNLKLLQKKKFFRNSHLEGHYF